MTKVDSHARSPGGELTFVGSCGIVVTCTYSENKWPLDGPAVLYGVTALHLGLCAPGGQTTKRAEK